MKTAAEHSDERFRPVNLEFLEIGSKDRFEIYYKTNSMGTTRFVKFASTDAAHQKKIRKILESGESRQEFFVKEKDLIKYYKHATQSLRALISDPGTPFEVKTKKLYNVSEDIMHEFFEFNASTKILRTSEEVMGLMGQCLSNQQSGLHAITMITQKDYYTYTHSVNVGLYCLVYGIKSKMNQNEIQELGLGGMLHDVGKVKIESSIINKKGRLTEKEFEVAKKHAFFGKEILESMGCYGINVINMAWDHHEQYDGKGYPKGLKGDEISMFGRICKVMDVYDALTTRRSYKKALSPFDALSVMNKNMFAEFDLKILHSFIKMMGPDE